MRQRARYTYLLIPFILLMVCLFLFSAVKLLESALLPKIDVGEQVKSRTIVRDGISYYPRQDIKVILLIGTDTNGSVQSSGSYNKELWYC